MNKVLNNVLTGLHFFVRPGIFLLLGLAVGYWFGFADAYREYDTLGAKVSRAVYKIHPAALSDGVAQRASVLRDTIQSKSGISSLPPD
jgi:hypothetical protein